MIKELENSCFKQADGLVVSPCEFCKKPILPGETGCFMGLPEGIPCDKDGKAIGDGTLLMAKVVAAHLSCTEESFKTRKIMPMCGDYCFCNGGLYDDGTPCRNCNGIGIHDARPNNAWSDPLIGYKLGEGKPPALFALVNREGKVETWEDGDSWTRLGIYLTEQSAKESLDRLMKAEEGYRVVRYEPQE